jgi:hypothetical protein
MGPILSKLDKEVKDFVKLNSLFRLSRQLSHPPTWKRQLNDPGGS